MTDDIAIELGTSKTLTIHNDKVVIDIPTHVARERISCKIIAVGKESNLPACYPATWDNEDSCKNCN